MHTYSLNSILCHLNAYIFVEQYSLSFYSVLSHVSSFSVEFTAYSFILQNYRNCPRQDLQPCKQYSQSWQSILSHFNVFSVMSKYSQSWQSILSHFNVFSVMSKYSQSCRSTLSHFNVFSAVLYHFQSV